MKAFNWLVFWSIVVAELLLVGFIAVRSHGAMGWQQFWPFVGFIVTAAMLAFPSWSWNAATGPNPGPLLAFGFGGIGGLGLCYALSSHVAGGFLLLGLAIQFFACLVNFIKVSGKHEI